MEMSRIFGVDIKQEPYLVPTLIGCFRHYVFLQRRQQGDDTSLTPRLHSAITSSSSSLKETAAAIRIQREFRKRWQSSAGRDIYLQFKCMDDWYHVFIEDYRNSLQACRDFVVLLEKSFECAKEAECNSNIYLVNMPKLYEITNRRPPRVQLFRSPSLDDPAPLPDYPDEKLRPPLSALWSVAGSFVSAGWFRIDNKPFGPSYCCLPLMETTGKNINCDIWQSVSDPQMRLEQMRSPWFKVRSQEHDRTEVNSSSQGISVESVSQSAVLWRNLQTGEESVSQPPVVNDVGEGTLFVMRDVGRLR